MKEAKNVNIKSLIISIIFLVILLGYRSFNGGSFLGLGAVITFVIISVVFLLVSFGTVRAIAFFVITEKIYPNILFRILLPLCYSAFFSFFVYGCIYIEPFGILHDFIKQFRDFIVIIVPFIVIFSIITGVILSIGLKSKEIAKSKKLLYNLLLLLLAGLLSVSSFFLFYSRNRIEQPELEPKYSSYENLGDSIISKNYEIKLLIEYDQYGGLCNKSRPYFLPNKKELIISSLIENERKRNRPTQFVGAYKINKYGKIIDKIEEREIVTTEHYPIMFQGGYIRDNDSTVVVTWAFDGNKTKQSYIDFRPKKQWKVEVLSEDKKSLKIVKFFKRYKFKSYENRFNGTKYYNIKLDNEILKFKIDSAYSGESNGKNNGETYDEKEIVFYKCKDMDFDLLCYDRQKYYIIKRR